MFLRLALCIGIAAAVTVAGPHPSRAQQSQTPPAAPATKPDAATPLDRRARRWVEIFGPIGARVGET